MNTITQLNRLSKKAPKKLRIISLYNLLSFWVTSILSIILIFIFLWVLPAEELTFIVLALVILVPAVLIGISFLMLHVNLKLLEGSKNAYWILLVLFAVQCIGIEIPGWNFNFQFGLPISFSFSSGGFLFKINVIAIIFTTYLISFQKDFPELLEDLKLNSRNA
ncbi:MAG: hypothetical protein R3214_03310 [Christiangramia sp.]|nr:hypothetical protein [Christiangramia sp.]